MFWGMNLKPNRKYSQTSGRSFHISQASLESEGLSDDATNKLYIINGDDNQKFLLCTLRKTICEQAILDLNFAEGDKICFQSVGSGDVSLSGYLVDAPFSDDEDEEISDVETLKALGALGNGKEFKKNKKKGKAAQDEDEEEDDDDDDDEEIDDDMLKAALESDDDDEEDDDEEDDEEDDDEEDDDDDDEEEEEEIAEPKQKIQKLDKKDPKQNKQQQQQNGVAGNAQKSKKEKKAEKQQQQTQQQQKQPAGGERTLTGGVKIEDIRVGNGPEAKNGKRAQVYYEGRLKSNNKVFDSLRNGTPFKFGIGRGEVIKGWDVGVSGMKVGGKRRITCPPHMAYGARGSPPTIPPNSTLVFEVELKGVN